MGKKKYPFFPPKERGERNSIQLQKQLIKDNFSEATDPLGWFKQKHSLVISKEQEQICWG